MDPEQTFIRVQERFSQILTPRLRAALEYVYLFIAVTLFCILVVMHANYVQQPGCSREFTGVKTADAQLFHIKITSVGFWSQNENALDRRDLPDSEHAEREVEVQNVNGKGLTLLAAKYWLNWIVSGVRRGKLVLKFWKTDNELSDHQVETFPSSQNSKSADDEAIGRTDKEESRYSFPLSAKETFKAAIAHFGRKWYRRLSFIWRLVKQIVGSFWKLWVSGLQMLLVFTKYKAEENNTALEGRLRHFLTCFREHLRAREKEHKEEKK